ncbi:MAG: hypothetical protein WAM66_14485 [Acidobacteriaceae bacterium]
MKRNSCRINSESFDDRWGRSSGGEIQEIRIHAPSSQIPRDHFGASIREKPAYCPRMPAKHGKDIAIDWLDRACDERSHWVIFLNTDPAFDGIRENPRFKGLLGKIGLLKFGDAPKGKDRSRKSNDSLR